MVDVHSPHANGTGNANGNGTDPAETSRDGLRRMQRLCEASRAASSPPAAAFHPLTSTLVYPPTGSGRRHLVTSIFTETSPRAIPLPPIFTRAETLSISPDGAWVTAYHRAPEMAGPQNAVGDLFLFPSALLEPGTTVGNFLPLASFPMTPPLAVLHVYPPRTRLSGQTAAPALGPSAPPGHVAARTHGPTLVVLTADLVYFLHPHPVPATVVLDTRSSAAAPHESVSATEKGESAPLNWTINALKCSIGSRSYTDLSSVATQPAAYPLYGAQRGWLGMVGGNDGVWAAVEKDGDVRVIRIDIGLDVNNLPFLSTAPLPALPRPEVPLFNESSQLPVSFLEQVTFVPLREHLVNGTAEEKAEVAEVKDESVSAIGAVMVYRDNDDGAPPSRSRTRFVLHELRHRPIAVVEAFKEITSGDDMAAPLDWVPAPAARTTGMSPEGTVVLALTPLPDVPPHTLAIALVATPSPREGVPGLILTHINLIPPAEADTAGTGRPRWPALVGEEYALDASLAGAGDVTLLPSQGVKRGEMGLVAVLGDLRPRLIPSPRLGAGASPSESVKNIAERAARSVELAVTQGVDWSDAVRAAFASVPRADANELASSIIDKAFALFVKHSRSYVPHLLRLQVAVWALADDPRRQYANELIRLGEATQIFNLCGEEREDGVFFDVDSAWNLVDVFEYALSVLGQTFRDAIGERAQNEWTPSEPRTEGSGRVLYLLHPLLRRIIARLINLLAAFAKFITTLNTPIRPPETAFLLARSAPASAVAAQRVLDALAREGVDLAVWRDVLATLSKAPRPSDADTCASLLKLDIGPLSSLLPSALQHIPTPSALFLSPSPSPERDGATSQVIGDRPTAKCDRCGARTILTGNQSVMRGGVPTPWAAWRRNWVATCMCGGTWVRTHLEMPPQLRRSM